MVLELLDAKKEKIISFGSWESQQDTFVIPIAVTILYVGFEYNFGLFNVVCLL